MKNNHKKMERASKQLTGRFLLRFMFALAMLWPVNPASGQSTNTPDTIIAQETAFWKAYVANDSASLLNLLSTDFINVEEQLWNRDQVIRFLQAFHSRCTLAPVEILSPKVTFLAPDVATLVYHATESPTCGARSTSGDTNITTVWVRHDDRWQMHLHTEYATTPKLLVK